MSKNKPIPRERGAAFASRELYHAKHETTDEPTRMEPEEFRLLKIQEAMQERERIKKLQAAHEERMKKERKHSVN